MGEAQSKVVSHYPTVLVIGGGAAGTTVARELDESGRLNVLLIEQRNFYFHHIGALRSAVQPEFIKKCIIPYDMLLTNGNSLKAKVKEITPEGVLLNAKVLPIAYDYLVLATGSTYGAPAKTKIMEKTKLASEYKGISMKIKVAEDIVIMGGGVLGVELAGEIREVYPDKNITILSRGYKLLEPGCSKDLYDDLDYQLKELNIKVMKGESCEVTPEQKEAGHLAEKKTWVTSKGTEVKADLTFFCVGMTPVINPFTKHFGNHVSENGRVLVNEYLQVEDQEKIFACGDCAEIESMTHSNAFEQAKCVANNILALEDKDKEEPEFEMISYEKQNKLLMIPLGTEHGVTQFPFLEMVVGEKMTSAVKGEDLLVSKAWSALRNDVDDPKSIELGTIENTEGRHRIKLANITAILDVLPEVAEGLMLHGLPVY